MLKGTGHAWALLSGKSWDNFIFKARFKFSGGTAQFVYRNNWGEKGPRRYYVGVHSNGLYLGKELDSQHSQLAQVNLQLDARWHTIEIRGFDNILNVYVDDELLIKYKDTSTPVLSGGVAFEPTEDDTVLFVDDVEIKPLNKEEVSSP